MADPSRRTPPADPWPGRPGFHLVAAHDQLRLRWSGIGHGEVGPEWGTGARPRCDSWHHLHLAIAGAARIWTATARPQRAMDLVPGRVYWLPGNLPVFAACPRSYRHLHAGFRLEILPGIEVLESWPEPMDLGLWSPDDLIPGWQGTDLADILSLQALLLGRLARLPAVLAAIGSPSDGLCSLASRLAALESRIDAATTVAWLARELDLPVRTLHTRFLRVLGKSPKAYLSGILRERARDLLFTTDRSATAIARHLGFPDEAYFYRWFHRWHGVAPIAFRTAYRR